MTKKYKALKDNLTEIINYNLIYESPKAKIYEHQEIYFLVCGKQIKRYYDIDICLNDAINIE